MKLPVKDGSSYSIPWSVDRGKNRALSRDGCTSKYV